MIVSLALFAALLIPAQGVLAETKELVRAKQNDVMYDAFIARPAAWFYLMAGIVQYVPAATVTWIAGKDTTQLDGEPVNKRLLSRHQKARVLRAVRAMPAVAISRTAAGRPIEYNIDISADSRLIGLTICRKMTEN